MNLVHGTSLLNIMLGGAWHMRTYHRSLRILILGREGKKVGTALSSEGRRLRCRLFKGQYQHSSVLAAN
jgi:hypothetical protein